MFDWTRNFGASAKLWGSILHLLVILHLFLLVRAVTLLNFRQGYGAHLHFRQAYGFRSQLKVRDIRTAAPRLDCKPVQANWDGDGHCIITCAKCSRSFKVHYDGG